MAELVGRQPELAFIGRFLDDVPSSPSVLVLEGEPGIGKTTLWRGALLAAGERSFRVLSCRPGQAEAKLSFSGVSDLLGPVADEVLPKLPAPQRLALEVALLRATVDGRGPDQRAVCAAFLGSLRSLASCGPLVIAADDVQWLDASSSRLLEFAFRRLDAEPVGLVASLRLDRQGPTSEPLGRAMGVPLERSHVLGVGPMSFDEIDRLIRLHLGIGLPRQTVLKLTRASGGNPFFALEIARALQRRGGRIEPGEPLPVPDDLLKLVRERIATLPPAAKQVLPFIAAMSEPPIGLVREAVGKSKARGLRTAADGGVIEMDADRVRFTHPLLASAVYSELAPEPRRRLHRRLARIVTEPEERARHLALAAAGPSPEIAEALEEAARGADCRGALPAAAELMEMAGGFTARTDRDQASRRRIEAADLYFECGDADRARAILQEVVQAASPGPSRARALCVLGRWAHDGGLDVLEQALAEAGPDLPLRLAIELELVSALAIKGKWDEARTHAAIALELANTLGDPHSLARALRTKAKLDFYTGKGIRWDLLDRAEALQQSAGDAMVWRSAAAARASMGIWADSPDSSRARLVDLIHRAEERGEDATRGELLEGLSEVEILAGNWELALRYVAEIEKETARNTSVARGVGPLMLRAIVHSRLGGVEQARAEAEEALGSLEGLMPGFPWIGMHPRSVQGFIELSLDHAAAAHGFIAPLLDWCASRGIGEPSVLRCVPDDVEALVTMGEVQHAVDVLEPFEERSRALDRPYGLATSARCRGMILAAQRDLPGAMEALDQALAEHERLAEPFELGRTLLVMGEIQRRAKHKRVARGHLEQALGIFDRLGAVVWSAKARAELYRVGGRTERPDELTPTERRVAELVAEGKTNQEVAEASFLAVKTVEVNLTRIYRKLGVRSRAELMIRMRDLALAGRQ
jgi:DNA-binding CsgD family transcriptional regulator